MSEQQQPEQSVRCSVSMFICRLPRALPEYQTHGLYRDEQGNLRIWRLPKHMRRRPRCAFLKADGKQCGNKGRLDTPFCFRHRQNVGETQVKQTA